MNGREARQKAIPEAVRDGDRAKRHHRDQVARGGREAAPPSRERRHRQDETDDRENRPSAAARHESPARRKKKVDGAVREQPVLTVEPETGQASDCTSQGKCTVFDQLGSADVPPRSDRPGVQEGVRNQEQATGREQLARRPPPPHITVNNDQRDRACDDENRVLAMAPGKQPECGDERPGGRA